MSKLLFHILEIGKKSSIFETKISQIVVFSKKGYSGCEIRTKMCWSKTAMHTAIVIFKNGERLKVYGKILLMKNISFANETPFKLDNVEDIFQLWHSWTVFFTSRYRYKRFQVWEFNKTKPWNWYEYLQVHNFHAWRFSMVRLKVVKQFWEKVCGSMDMTNK